MIADGTSSRGAVDVRSLTPRVSRWWIEHEPDRRHRRVEGSLVFIDISGFTAMSERLSRLGRVGAEEVTDLLNQTFTRLLACAYADGGSLLKFGGDALLLLFDGDDHCARAAHASWAMRRELRDLQPLESSAGKVRLRMSVGVASGAIDLFLVGARHRELVIGGTVASEVVRLEGSASAGEILLSPGLSDSLRDRITSTDSCGPGRALKRPPDVSAMEVPRDASSEDSARRLLPAAVWAHVGGGQVASEHRPAAVGFVKFSGVDDLLAHEGAHATADALEELVIAVDDATAPDDVCLLASDVDVDGGKLILTAGVPTSEEFDGERMLRAVRRLVDAQPRLPIKVGVHHGPVFSGAVGPPFRLTYTIIGDAVNTAARVMANAGSGEVLATAEALNRSQVLFEVESIEPFAAKGKKLPIQAYRVGAATAERRRRSRARFRLAGRGEELARLLGALDAAASGQGRIIELIGPAGIGKSRLIDELQERRPGTPVLLASCTRYESATPYRVAGDLVRSVLGLGAAASHGDLRDAVADCVADLLPLLPLLGDVTGIEVPDNAQTEELSASFRAERTVAAVGRLLHDVLVDHGMIVVEDLHWSDPESERVLRHLAAEAVPRMPCLLVMTSRVAPRWRSEDVETPTEVVDLGPLDADQASELVYAAVEEGVVSLARGKQLLERADGNPFFLQALLLVPEGDDLPDSVDALVQAQLDQLPVADRELLGHAAVLGNEIDLGLLSVTSGLDAADLEERLRALGEFVEPTGPGGFRFRHALVHDGAYARLPFRTRRTLHLAVVDALAHDTRRRGRLDLLALHTYRARDWARARDFAVEAGEAAAAGFANLTAAEHFRHALESHRRVHGAGFDPSMVWERLGDVLMLASSYDDAAAAYKHAKRLAPSERQPNLCSQIGQLRERSSRYPEALRWYHRGLQLAGERHGERARLLVERAIVRARQAKPAEARALADDAEAASPDTRTAARIAYVRAWCAMLEGGDGRAHERESLRQFRLAGDLVGQGLAYNIISMSAYYRGDWDVAADAYRRAAELRRRVGDEVAAAAAHGNLGELLADQGHFDSARELLEECRTVCAAAGFQSSRWFATMTLGRLDVRVGDVERGRARIEESLTALEAINMAWLIFDARRYLAEAHIFGGDFDAAARAIALVEESATFGGPGMRSVPVRLRVAASYRREDAATALDGARGLLGLIDPDGTEYDTALALAAVATVFDEAGVDDAPELRRRADASLARLGVVVPGELLVFGPSRVRALSGAADGS